MQVLQQIHTPVLNIFILVGAVGLLAPNSSEATLSCGAIIGPNQTVVLTHDVDSCPIAATALTVVGPATLDLGGHTVECYNDQNSTGILVTGEGAVVRNGTISTCYHGVILLEGARHLIQNMTVEGRNIDDESGIELRHSNGNAILNNALTNLDIGIVGYNSSNDNLFDGNTSNNNFDGFYVVGLNTGNTFRNNEMKHYTRYGYVVEGNDNVLSQNRALGGGVGHIGFLIGDGDGNVVRQNYAEENTGLGFFIAVGSGFVVTRNTAKNNFEGILMDTGAMASIIYGNTASDNSKLDLHDSNTNCNSNVWIANKFVTSEPVNCIH